MVPAGLTTAIRTLSILPSPGKDAFQPALALPWFPLAGCLLGSIVYGLSLTFSLFTGGSWPTGTAIVAVICGVALTRALHLDGLADWADSFGSITDRERRLAIMKDSQLGVFGVTALIVVVFVKVAAVSQLATHDGLIWIVGAYIVSRTMQVELAVVLPYARPEGGTGASFVTGARATHRIWAWVVATALTLLFLGPFGVGALLVGSIIARIFGYWCSSRIGGVTGDLLGTCSELTEAAVLFCCAAAGSHLTALTGWNIVV